MLMSSIRQSFLFSLEAEDGFGKGKASGYSWIAPPPMSFFDSTTSVATTRVQSAGSKYLDTIAYGKRSGTWRWSFVMDYNYLEPLYLVFEGSDPGAGTARTVGDKTAYEYTFKKTNGARVRSFTVRRVKLNIMAGGLRSTPNTSGTTKGGLDEIVELVGCVCTNATFSRASSSSQMNVELSGFYVDEQMYKGRFGKTDYQPYSGNLTEYACLFIGGVSDDTYVANTESLSISINNQAEAIHNICTPIGKEYAENVTDYSFSTTAYSNDPSHWEQRVYSGGFDNDVLKPMTKGLKPISEMHIVSYDGTLDPSNANWTDAITNSAKRLDIDIRTCEVKSLQWQSGDGSKLQDVISSSMCGTIEFTVYSPVKTTAFTTENEHDVPNYVGKPVQTQTTSSDNSD